MTFISACELRLPVEERCNADSDCAQNELCTNGVCTALAGLPFDEPDSTNNDAGNRNDGGAGGEQPVFDGGISFNN